MTRPLLSLFLLLMTLPSASGQVKGLLGLPDRMMSSSRIGQVSSREVPQLPMPDSSKVVFPSAGTDFISEDYDFFKYLLDNGYSLDASTLSKHPYSPSDTLDFLRAKVLFSDRKLSQAADLFSKVPVSSVFGPESLFYGVVSLSTLGEYDRASWMMDSVSEEPVFSEGGPYSELALLQNAGLALLRGNKDDWLRLSGGFTYSDYSLEESERILSEIGSARFSSRHKRAGVAALASAIVPGAGKIYAGRLGEGVAAFLTVGSLGAVTAENWSKHGMKDWRTIVSGALCATFYLGNIYGSYMSVSIEKDERLAAENTLVLYHLHLPLRSIFR